MNLHDALNELNVLQKKMHAFSHATGIIYLDSVTVAPEDTAAGRGETLGILTSLSYEIFANPKTEELLDFLGDNKDKLTFQQARELEVLTRDFEQIRKIPQEEYVEFQVLLNESQNIWFKAKKDNDFSSFAPYIERIVNALKGEYNTPDNIN